MEDNFTKKQGEEIVRSILDMAVNYKNLSVKETTGDKTFTVKILAKESNGNYTIELYGTKYTNIPSAYGYQYEINDKVEARANLGNMDLLKIISPKALVY